ncbi:Eefsec [Scenedesmus sp. PABB004]|nr:Eefsec [Scenedesmus sp. PABB004]
MDGLAAEHGFTYEVVKPDIDEKAIRRDEPRELVLALAHAKADAVLEMLRRQAPPGGDCGDGYLITCDQVVLHEGAVREKPADVAEAHRFIHSYAASPAQTVGGVVATRLRTGKRVEAVEVCAIHMTDMPDDVIDALIAEGDVMWCAGGLMVEHPAVVPYVTRIEGTQDAVMGLGRDTVMALLLDAAGIGEGRVAGRGQLLARDRRQQRSGDAVARPLTPAAPIQAAMSVLNVNVGVLGHVDCGKTSLVAVLSSTLSTAALDKHPQSRERGITLDLGFSSFTVPMPLRLAAAGAAESELQFTLVDCPGHASLIRTILGGAAIIDTMVLVIDVTKGFQAQTAECLVVGEIAARELVVALNKVDLLPEAVRSKGVKRATRLVREALAATKFAGAAVIPVSAKPEPLGVEELKGWLVDSAVQRLTAKAGEAAAGGPSGAAGAAAAPPFLFAIDHCFAVKGQGTVLTGTVLQGGCRVGETVELPALKLRRAVKGMQMFRRPVEAVRRGDRAALCVTQLDPGAIERGLAAAPGAVPTFAAAVAAVDKVRFYAAAVPSRSKFHVSIGHATVMAEALFFGLPDAPGGASQADALRLMVEALARTSLHGAPAPAFDFGAEYLAQDALHGLEGRPLAAPAPAGARDGAHHGPQWALLRFEQPVTAPLDSVIVGARLDADSGGDACRLAFYGRLAAGLGDGGPAELRRLRVFKVKERVGSISRPSPDGGSAIAGGLFKRETDLSVFAGAAVTTGAGERGVVCGRFGTSGKVRVDFPPPGLRGEPPPRSAADNVLRLAYKRFLFEPDRHAIRHVRSVVPPEHAMEEPPDESGGGDAPAQQQAFALTKELALSSDLRLALWCPTMDLCAVVAADGQLRLHRMDWQQLWATAPESPVTALAWRPDGKALAAGHAGGGLSIVDVETGDVTAEHAVHYASIAALSWSDQHAPPQAGEQQQRQPDGGAAAGGGGLLPQAGVAPHQRYRRLFVPPVTEPHPPSSTEPPPDPYDLAMEAAGTAAWPAERPCLSLLAAADARGHVSLWLQGEVQVAELAGGLAPPGGGGGDGEAQQGEEEEEEEEPYKLLHVTASAGLDQLITVHASPSGGVALASHSLALLRVHQEPLQQCTALFSQLQALLKAAVKGVEVASQDWAGAMADFRKRFDAQLRQELADHGSTITVPQQELVLLLATGCPTPPMQTFLASTLGEAGLRRLARALDATAGGLHTALLERLMPLTELALFLLGELRGCVTAQQDGGGGGGGGGGDGSGSSSMAGGGWLGLAAPALRALELNAAALLLRVEQLRRAVTGVACGYRAFFSWLLRTLRTLDGGGDGGGDVGLGGDAGTPLPQAQEVLAFLRGQFAADVIGPELTGDLHGGGVGAHGEACGPGAAALAAAAEACGRPLAAQLAALAGMCEEAFEAPAMAISPAIAAQTGRLQLVPARPARGAAAAPAAAAAAQAVAVGPPVLQPARCRDLHVYVCCALPAAGGGGGGGAQQLLLVRLPPDSLAPQLGQGQEEQGLLAPRHSPPPPRPLAADALLLELPRGEAALAWAAYQGEQLALLTHDRGGGGDAGLSGSSLQLLELAAAPWAALPAGALGRGGAAAAAAAAGAVVAAADLPRRARRFAHAATGQLAVSRTRGLAAVVSELQHLLLLDLEEDEEGGGSEEGSGDERMSE